MKPKKTHTATMKLPKGGIKAWTDIMQAAVPVSVDIYTLQPM